MEIISNGETLDVEFKGEEHRQLNDRELIEAVVCMSNRSSGSLGRILVGVEDDGRVTGARRRHEVETDPYRVSALLASHTRPSLTCRVEVIRIDGRDVLVIEVPPGRTPVGTADGKYVRRVIGGNGRPSCVPFHYHEMQARVAEQGALDFTSLVVEGATWEDLDPLEFARFRRSILESPAARGDRSLLDLSDIDMAKALGAVEANHEVRAIRVLGLLLFGREEALQRYLPAHEAAFQVFSGNEVRLNRFYRWPLIRLLEEFMGLFGARNEEREIMVGMVRVGVPDYAEAAVREGLANAFIHRDYTRLGAVYVQWRPEQLSIISPGGFPNGVRLENLLVAAPTPRNPLLADAFKRAGLVERTARGIDTIFYEQVRNGRPRPSYNLSTEAAVRLDLPGGPSNLEFVRFIVEEQRTGPAFSVAEMLVLNELLFQRRITTRDVVELTQQPEPTVRGIMARLEERGVVEALGSVRSREFQLAAGVYDRLGSKVAYTRLRGFDAVQHNQMVLHYVRDHGRVTRREVAELCRVKPTQAKRILDRLRSDGLLKLVGTRRGAYYVPTGPARPHRRT